MKVLEIKNNLVKISNENRSKLILGGFVVIEDESTPYVGQIVSLKADNGISYAIARLIFTFNEEGIVKNYDGTIPTLEAEVSKLSAKDLLDILPIETPVKLGNLAQQDFMLNVDISLLQSNLLICSDSAKNTSTIVMNFAKQLENNAESTVIFDIDGRFKEEKRFVFGENFKMPLNFDSINFIYANDLNDVDATSKAVIQDIFLEVQEYTRQVADKFIPFDTFIDVVEQQYAESNIPELALLKNKLLKYKEDNVFAQSKYELQSLREYIKDNYTVILDISEANPKLQKEIITYVYSVLEEMRAPITTFVKLNEDNSDKKFLKSIFNKNSIYTNLVCNHTYKYVYELKEQADNLILFIPETTRHDFASYNTFLNKLNHDEFIVWGKATQRIPLIVELSPLVIKKEEPIRITMDEPLPSPEKEKNELEEKLDEIKQEELQPQEETKAERTPNIVLPILETPKVEETKVEDFTQNEDTYTDLSDDVERIEPVEEDYSAIKEENEPSLEATQEDDFDQELEDSIESALDEPQNKEASTNDFFTGTKLQEETPFEVVDISPIEENREETEIIKVTPLEEPQEEEIIPETLTFREDSSIEIEPEIQVENFNNEEPTEPISDEIQIETVAEEAIEAEEIEENNSYIENNYDEYDEDYVEDGEFITSEPTLQMDEEFSEETPFGSEFSEEMILPDPTIDERIEEDLPEVETLFEEIPPEEMTPYENTLTQEPAQLMTDDDELIEQVAKEVDEAFIYNKIESDDLLDDENSLTEDDLNFIDDINMNEDENPEEFEQIQNNSASQSEDLPIYPAKMPKATQIFEPGDHVAHPKYGEGIVEKMINAGDKSLCSINFANFGRRLLDPAISNITVL